MMKVLLDSSSAILLYKAGLIHKFFDSVECLLPMEVFDELTCCAREGADWFQLKNGFTVLPRVHNAFSSWFAEDQIRALKRFGSGERAVLASLLTGKARYAVIDDGPAARFFHRQGLQFLNALLVPRVLFLRGLITFAHCRDFQNHLIDLGRYGLDVIQFALHCNDDKLDYFL